MVNPPGCLQPSRRWRGSAAAGGAHPAAAAAAQDAGPRSRAQNGDVNGKVGISHGYNDNTHTHTGDIYIYIM